MSTTAFLRRALLAPLFTIALATPVFAQPLTIAWDPNTEADLGGYLVLYGESSGTYTDAIDVGLETSHTLTTLDLSVPHYFAVRAYSNDGVKSPISVELAYTPPPATTMTGFSASRTYPLLVGQPVTWTASATSLVGATEFSFWMYSASAGWTMVRPYSPSATFTWTPGWEDVGTHAIQVWARGVGSTRPYEAWVGTPSWQVNAVPMQLTSDVEFPTPAGNPVTWTASVAGSAGDSLEYQFWLFTKASKAWTPLRGWSTDNQYVWTPSANGTYAVQAWARRVGSTAAYDTYTGTPQFVVGPSPLKVTSLQADTTLPASTGTSITWTARAKGGYAGPLEYSFWMYSENKHAWKNVAAYSTSNTYTWTPTWGDEGRYALQVWVRSSGSLAVYEEWLGTPYFDIERASIQLTANGQFPMPPGATVQWKAATADPTVALEYQYWLYDQGTGNWGMARNYSPESTFDWTPAKTGAYAMQVWARRQGSSAAFELWRGTDYLDVVATPARLVSLKSDREFPAAVGTPVVWTATATGGLAGPLRYQFWVYQEGAGWSLGRDWSTSNTFNWTPAGGRYAVQVWVRSAGSTATYEHWLGTGFFEIQ